MAATNSTEEECNMNIAESENEATTQAVEFKQRKGSKWTVEQCQKILSVCRENATTKGDTTEVNWENVFKALPEEIREKYNDTERIKGVWKNYQRRLARQKARSDRPIPPKRRKTSNLTMLASSASTSSIAPPQDSSASSIALPQESSASSIAPPSAFFPEIQGMSYFMAMWNLRFILLNDENGKLKLNEAKLKAENEALNL